MDEPDEPARKRFQIDASGEHHWVDKVFVDEKDSKT